MAWDSDWKRWTKQFNARMEASGCKPVFDPDEPVTQVHALAMMSKREHQGEDYASEDNNE